MCKLRIRHAKTKTLLKPKPEIAHGLSLQLRVRDRGVKLIVFMPDGFGMNLNIKVNSQTDKYQILRFKSELLMHEKINFRKKN